MSSAEGFASSNKMVCPTCGNEFPGGARFCPHDGQQLEEVQSVTDLHKDKFLGAILDDRYQIEQRIGHGGMGVVYQARHVVIDKPVAIKILRHEYCRDPGLVERFMREARAASRIGHPNIVDVTDFGRLPDGHIYFVMEYLVGTTLSAEIRSQGYMPIERVLDLSIQMCHGLQAAHTKGIVHRDLKPENVFILNPSNAAVLEEFGGQRTDFVKLLDFGIAKFSWAKGTRLTKVGSIFGTPQYMSPEQAAGQDADHRGDVYSLGCIVYEMVTGEVPFLADTFMGTLTKHMFEKPMPPRQLRPDIGIPEEIEEIILRSMAKDPAERYASMTEMAAALNTCYTKPRAPLPQETFPPGETNVALQANEPTEAREVPELDATGPVLAELHDEPDLLRDAPAPSDVRLDTLEDEDEDDDDYDDDRLELGDIEEPPTRKRRRRRDPPPTEMIRQARRGGSALPWVAAIFGLALIGGVVYLVKFRGYLANANGTGSGSATGSALTSTGNGGGGADKKPDDDDAKTDDGKKLVALWLVTVPSGAEILADGRSLGHSPVKLMLEPGRKTTLTFEKKGFRKVVRLITAPQTDRPLTVKLERRRRGRHRWRRRTTNTTTSPGTSGAPSKRDLRNPFGR